MYVKPCNSCFCKPPTSLPKIYEYGPKCCALLLCAFDVTALLPMRPSRLLNECWLMMADEPLELTIC